MNENMDGSGGLSEKHKPLSEETALKILSEFRARWVQKDAPPFTPRQTEQFHWLIERVSVEFL